MPDNYAEIARRITEIREQQDRRRFEVAQYGKAPKECVADIDFLLGALTAAADQRERETWERSALLMCGMCSAVHNNPNGMLIGPAEFREEVWGHWLTKGKHSGEFAGHCSSAAIRSQSAPVEETVIAE